METNFPTILKELREKAGFESQTKFAEASGVDNSTIARLERGETKPSPKTLDKLAPILRVPLMQLMISAGYLDHDPEKDDPSTGERSLRLTVTGLDTLGLKEIKVKDMDFGQTYTQSLGRALRPGDLVRIPVLGTIKAGYNSLAQQEIIGYELISTTSIGDGAYFYLRVTGDSMVDAGIKEGYRVLVKHQNFVEQGKIAVVLVNGDEGTLKRVYYQDSQVILQSENAEKKYPPRILNAEDVLIQGQVCKVEFDVP